MDWMKVRRIFEAACGLPEAERAAYVRAEAAGSPEMENEVLHMLRVVTDSPGFLDAPVARISDAPADDAPPPRLVAGDLINGRYAIEDQIGSGGSSFVYLASDRQLAGRRVVIKVLRTDLDEQWVRHRFDKEIEALSKVQHPGVVSVLDRGSTAGGAPCVVLQYIEGKILRILMTESAGPWPISRVIPLLSQMARALAAVHAEGVCHRDIRPENVIVRNAGHRDEQPVLIDFGIATMPKTSAATTRVTGTPEYMAPEQLLGRPVPASDVYSLGAVGFELLTGQCWHQCLPRVQSDTAELHGFYPPQVPSALRAAIAKAVCWDASGRYSDALSFADAVERSSPSNSRLAETRMWRIPSVPLPERDAALPLNPESTPPPQPTPGEFTQSFAALDVSPGEPAQLAASAKVEGAAPVTVAASPSNHATITGDFTRAFQTPAPAAAAQTTTTPGDFTCAFEIPAAGNPVSDDVTTQFDNPALPPAPQTDEATAGVEVTPTDEVSQSTLAIETRRPAEDGSLTRQFESSPVIQTSQPAGDDGFTLEFKAAAPSQPLSTPPGDFTRQFDRPAKPPQTNQQPVAPGEFTRQFGGRVPDNATVPAAGNDLPWIQPANPSARRSERNSRWPAVFDRDDSLFGDLPARGTGDVFGGSAPQASTSGSTVPGDYTRIVSVPVPLPPSTPAPAAPASAAASPAASDRSRLIIGSLLLCVIVL